MIQREGLRNEKLCLLLKPPAATQHKGGASRCDDWHVYYKAVTMAFSADPDGDLEEVITRNKGLLRRCSYCLKSVEVWERAVYAMRTGVGCLSFSSIYERYAGNGED